MLQYILKCSILSVIVKMNQKHGTKRGRMDVQQRTQAEHEPQTFWKYGTTVWRQLTIPQAVRIVSSKN